LGICCILWLTVGRVELQIIAGLTHSQEFTEIDRVFPAVSQFFEEQIESIGDLNVER